MRTLKSSAGYTWLDNSLANVLIAWHGAFAMMVFVK